MQSSVLDPPKEPGLHAWAPDSRLPARTHLGPIRGSRDQPRSGGSRGPKDLPKFSGRPQKSRLWGGGRWECRVWGRGTCDNAAGLVGCWIPAKCTYPVGCELTAASPSSTVLPLFPTYNQSWHRELSIGLRFSKFDAFRAAADEREREREQKRASVRNTDAVFGVHSGLENQVAGMVRPSQRIFDQISIRVLCTRNASTTSPRALRWNTNGRCRPWDVEPTAQQKTRASDSELEAFCPSWLRAPDSRSQPSKLYRALRSVPQRRPRFAG